MKYPLKTHKTGMFFPASGCCGQCGKSNNGKFACLTFSAMERIGNTDSFGPADVIKSVHLCDHGVNASGKGFTLFENIDDAYFCSTACLRAFFDQVITDFDNGVE
ncbi:MAG: hypothetical protein V4495_26895 [Pseudomonadota bacterium]